MPQHLTQVGTCLLYTSSLDVADNTIVLKNKIGENLSTITVPYANSAGNVATSIKEMGIAVQTASPYAWFLNYTGSGNKDGARKYYASVYADNATYSTSAGNSNNIVIYNNNWSGTDVYKRQQYNNRLSERKESKRIITRKEDIMLQKFNYFGEHESYVIRPVSYTHLDVYKRQILTHIL